MKKVFLLVIVIIFVALAVTFYTLSIYAPAYNHLVLHIGNVMMLTLSLVSYLLVMKDIKSRPQAFVRGVYSASFLKLFVCMIAIMAYVLINKPNIHKPTLFMLFGIYAVYSIAETMMLSRMARQQK